MHRTTYGHGRQLAGLRRGAPVAPKRKRVKAPPDQGVVAQKGLGFEAFLSPADREPLHLPHLLEEDPSVDRADHEGIALGSGRREGFLVSTIIHLMLIIIAIVKPDLLAPADREPEAAAPHDRLVLMVEPPPAESLTLPPALSPPPQPEPEPQPPDGSRMVIPKATQPAPPDKQQDFQTDLPFSEGNTDEFYTDEAAEEPGEEGQPSEGEAGEREAQTEEARRLADLLASNDFRFRGAPLEPTSPPDVNSPGGKSPDGQDGEGGTFEDIRRFMEDKRFHNPEGGLVTGRDNTLYYDDKGANFVPWIRRMLAEVRRNWLVPYTAAFQAGHVAVAVSVDRNGDIYALEVVVPSGKPGFDNASAGALRASDFLPLPSDYPDERFDFLLVFWYNERPYDIF